MVKQHCGGCCRRRRGVGHSHRLDSLDLCSFWRCVWMLFVLDDAVMVWLQDDLASRLSFLRLKQGCVHFADLDLI